MEQVDRKLHGQFGIRKFYELERFYKGEDGYYCYGESNSVDGCFQGKTGKEKEQMKNSGLKMGEDEMKMLKEFFSPFNKMVKDDIGIENSWNTY